jgi:hypothetical protein
MEKSDKRNLIFGSIRYKRSQTTDHRKNRRKQKETEGNRRKRKEEKGRERKRKEENRSIE